MASHWDKGLSEALMQGGGDVVDLDEAVVDRGGIKPKGVAHDVRLGSLENLKSRTCGGGGGGFHAGCCSHEG